MTDYPFQTRINEFQSSAARVVNERDERLANAKLRVPYHHGFLDDVLRGILPHDLILIGAPSGVGKTDIAVQIAASNVTDEHRFPVAFFALEAEPREIERRMKFSMISRWAHGYKGLPAHERAWALNFSDWMAGKCEDISNDYEMPANAVFLEKFGGLHTFYRDVDFGYEELRTAIKAIAPKVRLIVIDHLHYIDNDDDNEARGLADTMKMLRDLTIILGKPVILIAHLRKRPNNTRQVVATLDDFHGSSNIVKQATHAITLDRAHGIEAKQTWLSPTFCSILKDRRGGETGHVALTMYDRRKRTYQKTYSLGRIGESGWEEVGVDRLPRWAENHRAWQVPS